MTMTTYPTSEDYIRAVQNPGTAFSVPMLQAATFTADPLMGIPMPASGSAAVVFRAQVNGMDRALRFYVRPEDDATRKRYKELGRHLTHAELLPRVAAATWIDNAITVRSQTWPMVDMQWVDGRTLDDYVSFLARGRESAALSTLAQNWLRLIETLQNQRFAHGDLQHGNVLVDGRSALRLVDFDGSWVEDFNGMRPPAETGNPSYQRPDRVWGRWMDTFPGLVVYTALLGLAKNPDRWTEDSTKEKILFSPGDFDAFDTPTWRLLDATSDPEVIHAARLLKHCCRPGWVATGSLRELLTGRPPVIGHVVSKPRRSDEPWWIQTGAASPLPPPPLAATDPKPAASSAGPGATHAVRNWHQRTDNRTSPPPRPHGGPVHPRPVPPRPAPPTPQPSKPAHSRSWGTAFVLAVLCGVLFGVVAIGLLVKPLHSASAATYAGLFAGAIFGLLMLVILRPRS